jgi:hypothetical protein
MPWEYEPSPDGKHKRSWDQPVPGFVEKRGELVGKCPTTISCTPGLAQHLINHEDTISYRPIRWQFAHPERIYVIHDGHLYRATSTVPGKSYHGFPEHPSRALKLPRNTKDRILELARHLGCETEIAKCLKGK